MADDSPILKLPGELRNPIHDFVFEDFTILRINKRGFLVPHPLSAVCRQIYDEVQASGFLDHSLATRPSLELLGAYVVDCDFGHVIKFLQSVPQNGLAHVRKGLKVTLRLTGAVISPNPLLEWFNCMTGTDLRYPNPFLLDYDARFDPPETRKHVYDVRC